MRKRIEKMQTGENKRGFFLEGRNCPACLGVREAENWLGFTLQGLRGEACQPRWKDIEGPDAGIYAN